MKALLLVAPAFIGAALLVVLLPSTWALLVVRIVLICLGVVAVVISLRQRKRLGGNVYLVIAGRWRRPGYGDQFAAGAAGLGTS
jgi:uncharacterized membrane protein